MSEGTEYVNDGITDLPDKLADCCLENIIMNPCSCLKTLTVNSIQNC